MSDEEQQLESEPEPVSEPEPEPEPEPVKLVSSHDKKYTYCHYFLYDHWKDTIAVDVYEANELMSELVMDDEDIVEFRLSEILILVQLNHDLNDKFAQCSSLEDLKQLLIQHHS